MISQIFDESPKETQLITSDDESQNLKKIDKNVNGTNKIQMKKQLGLLEGIAIILGIICGSGKVLYDLYSFYIFQKKLFLFTMKIFNNFLFFIK